MLHLSSYHSNGLPTVVWSNKVNLIGEKVYKPKIHFCEHCNKPILIYGRLIPCKHVFCFSCATLCLTQQQQQQQQQQQTNFQLNTGDQTQATINQPRSAQNKPQHQAGPTPVIYLEHVQLIIDLEYSSRGAIDIFLISPAGTVSTLLSRRPLDVSRSGFDKWPLMTVHFWAESSLGSWTLIVRDKDSQNNRGLLRNATLVLHGTSVRPQHAQQVRRYEGESEVPAFIDPVLELDEDDIYDLNTFPNEMALVKDDSFQPTFIKSIVAMEAASRERSRLRQ